MVKLGFCFLAFYDVRFELRESKNVCFALNKKETPKELAELTKNIFSFILELPLGEKKKIIQEEVVASNFQKLEFILDLYDTETEPLFMKNKADPFFGEQNIFHFLRNLPLSTFKEVCLKFDLRKSFQLCMRFNFFFGKYLISQEKKYLESLFKTLDKIKKLKAHATDEEAFEFMALNHHGLYADILVKLARIDKDSSLSSFAEKFAGYFKVNFYDGIKAPPIEEARAGKDLWFELYSYIEIERLLNNISLSDLVKYWQLKWPDELSEILGILKRESQDNALVKDLLDSILYSLSLKKQNFTRDDFLK